eukprot:TRINITY_DN1632_c0_g1_i1.p2 TRINITY_DN1632_c0_g1~~TRINITY_DN1632_c0_g1_i1.p2  ORF type:complete len:149 (-),score=23.22 TRINITY_DN1632_c0_g1_i1:42-488(-)
MGAYSKQRIITACNLVRNGAKLIGTNSDVYDPVEYGCIAPSCGSWIAVIEKTVGINAYFVGKPNAFMVRSALNELDLHTSEVALFGDRMETDIRAGVEADIDTCLLLSGVCSLEEATTNKFAWSPYLVLDNIGEITPSSYSKKYNPFM